MFLRILKEGVILGLGMFVGELVAHGLQRAVKAVQERTAKKGKQSQPQPRVRGKFAKRTNTNQ